MPPAGYGLKAQCALLTHCGGLRGQVVQVLICLQYVELFQQGDDTPGVPREDNSPVSRIPRPGFGSLHQDTTHGSHTSPPSLNIPNYSRRGSPASSKLSSTDKNSSISSTPPRKRSGVVTLSSRGGAGGRSLGERLQAALGERTGPDEADRRLVSNSLG